jgi:hypothetical protein
VKRVSCSLSYIARSAVWVVGFAILAGIATEAALAQTPSQISGPRTVRVGEMFRLCAPEGWGSYHWIGPRVGRHARSRCIDILSLPIGTHQYTLTLERAGERVEWNHEMVVTRSHGDFAIAGPRTVYEGESFVLSGPEGSGTYMWEGRAVRSNPSARSITNDGLAPGSYNFKLTVIYPEGVEMYAHRVTVLRGSAPQGGCAITGPSMVAAQTAFTLCGPQGDYGYLWTGPGLSGMTSRCMTHVGLDPGTHLFTLTLSRGGVVAGRCSVRVAVSADTTSSCLITGPAIVSPGANFSLCGPVGAAEYHWSPAGARTQCAEFTAHRNPGTHTYKLKITQPDGSKASCSFQVRVLGETQPGEAANCPRKSDFWKKQCDLKEHKSLTRDEVTRIARCIDERSSVFTWEDAFNGFCAVFDKAEKAAKAEKDDKDGKDKDKDKKGKDPRDNKDKDGKDKKDKDEKKEKDPKDPKDGKDEKARDKAAEEYAALLANVCAGELGIRDADGDPIKLDLSTRVSCKEFDGMTLAELITHVEAAFAQPLSDDKHDKSKKRFEEIEKCLKEINEGKGIGDVCGKHDKDQGPKDPKDNGGLAMSQDTPAAGLLYRPSPNPFSTMTQMSYAVEGTGARVEMGVYDLSGRMVKKLVSGFQSGGRHVASWDGRDGAGARVKAGVYFLRGLIGERRVTSRMMYVK